LKTKTADETFQRPPTDWRDFFQKEADRRVWWWLWKRSNRKFYKKKTRKNRFFWGFFL
jgi:hypothetical protein